MIISDAGDGARFGIVVDELCGHQQVVVKSIEESYGSVPGIAGATILGNGRVAFILDVEKLSDLAGQQCTECARHDTSTPAASMQRVIRHRSSHAIGKHSSGAVTMPAAAILKVLVVDDQNSVRQMTRITLEQIGIRQIHEAENGKLAMDTAALQPLDLIISDFNMPEMDGLALLRAVRGHPAARKVPFILLTGRGDRELVVKAAQAGANNYLIKPFTADILRQKIEQVMGRLS